jgi:hypothetical protein
MPTSPQKPLIAHDKPLHQFEFPPPYPLGFSSLGMFPSPPATTANNLKTAEHLNYGNTFNPYTQYQQNYSSYCASNFRYKTPY